MNTQLIELADAYATLTADPAAIAKARQALLDAIGVQTREIAELKDRSQRLLDDCNTWAQEAKKERSLSFRDERDTLRASFDKLAAAVGWTKERCEQTGDSPIDVAEALRAELEAIRAQEPVAVVESDAPGGIAYTPAGLELVDGQELYAAPAASPDVGALVEAAAWNLLDEVDEVRTARTRREEDFGKLNAADDALRAALTQSQAARVPDGWKLVRVDALTRWRNAFAEELSAWDIDPPIHHVKAGYDEIEALLAAAPGKGGAA